MLIPRLRSALTLVVLVGVLLFGVSYGFSAVTEPFPERDATPVCTEAAVAKGEKIFPDQVTVSVLNAGERSGLASRTMSQLVGVGYGRGDLANAPEGTDVKRVEIWTDEPNNPDVRLVQTYLGTRKALIVRRDTVAVGVNVVVGDRFKDLRKGRKGFKAKEDTSVCMPPAAPTPDEPAPERP